MDLVIDFLKNSFDQRVLVSIACVILGAVAGWLGGRWRRFHAQRKVESGDAREVASIEKVLLIDHGDGRRSLRIRSCGRDSIDAVFPNPAAHDVFLNRALATTATRPLIAMEGKLGSYLLQELAIWVCDKVGEHNFPHDVWVMTAVCETNELGGHQSTTLLLVRRSDLASFRTWTLCKDIQVEHGGHGQRILTLVQVAAEFDRQNAAIEARRSAGKSSTYEETMYVLDLGLDTRIVDLPTKPAPWGRFAAVLKALELG